MSSGELSHGLPALATSGNHIVRSDTNTPILLRGINRSGLEYSQPGGNGFLDAAGITQAEIQEIATNWQANILRIPFNQDWALRGRDLSSASDYLTALDQVVDWAAACGAYTLLDLQWMDLETVFGHLGDGSENRVAPLPNPDSLLLWGTLAERYRNEPAVLFDLLNEPHDPLPDDYQLSFVIGDNGEPAPTQKPYQTHHEWRLWATRLVREIRSTHPDSLIFVSGADWAYDLRHIRLAAPNIVYSAHVYSNREARGWNKYFGHLARHAPVFVAEWGGDDNDLDWGHRLTFYLRHHGIGWAAWSWVDKPHLLAEGAPVFVPTRFGTLVQSELRV